MSSTSSPPTPTTKDLVLDKVKQFLEPIPQSLRPVVIVDTQTLHKTIRCDLKSIASYSITPSLLHQWCESSVESFRFTFESSHGNKGKKNAAKRGRNATTTAAAPAAPTQQTQVQNLPPGVRLRGISAVPFGAQANAPVLLMPPQEHANLLRDFQSMQEKYNSLIKECEALKQKQQMFELSGTTPSSTGELSPLLRSSFPHTSPVQPTRKHDTERREERDAENSRTSPPLKRRRTESSSTTLDSLRVTTINGMPFVGPRIASISPDSGRINTPLYTTLSLEGFTPGDVLQVHVCTVGSNAPASVAVEHRLPALQANRYDLHVPLGTHSTPQTLKIWVSSRTTLRVTTSVDFRVTNDELCSTSPECSDLLTLDDQADFDLDLLDIFDKADATQGTSGDGTLPDDFSPDFFEFANSPHLDQQQQHVQQRKLNIESIVRLEDTSAQLSPVEQSVCEPKQLQLALNKNFSPHSTHSSVPATERLAVVIGNNIYRNLPPLQSSIDDVSKMQKVLENNGFTVVRIDNATKEELVNNLSRIKQEYSGTQRSLQDIVVHYSGHAIRDCICPVDSDLSTERTRDSSTLPYAEMVQYIPSAQHSLLVLDCCDSGSAHEIKSDLDQLSLAPQNLHILSSVSASHGGPSVECDMDGVGGILTSAFVSTIGKAETQQKQMDSNVSQNGLSLGQIYTSVQTYFKENFRALSMDESVQSPKLSQLRGSEDYVF